MYWYHNDESAHGGVHRWRIENLDSLSLLSGTGLLDSSVTLQPLAIFAKAFQAEKGLKADGLIGPDTWKAAWDAPVTPPAQPGPDPTPTPEEPKPTPGATPRTPTYPRAARAWNVPLSSDRASGGSRIASPTAW